MKKMRVAEFGATLVLMTAAAALADGGSVVPSSQEVAGYSLAAAAQATAVYNSGVQAGNPATPAPPVLPFNLVVPDGNTTVQASEDTYVPIFDVDNSAPADPNFPASVADQAADAAYLDNYVLSNYGVSAFIVQVDGTTTTLDDSFITGVDTPTLLDGTPGGDEYISSSVFLSPLSVGDHTISLGGVIDGAPVVFVSYDVDAVPEPASISLLGIGALGLLRRRRA